MIISFTIPDAVAPRVVQAVCFIYGYQPFLPDPDMKLTIPNPETAAQFAKRKIAEYIKSLVVQYEGSQAAVTAQTTAQDKATADISIT